MTSEQFPPGQPVGGGPQSQPQQPLRPQLVQTTRPAKRGGSWIFKLLFLFVLGALGLSMLLNLAVFAGSGSSSGDDASIVETYRSGSESRSADKIAVINVKGAILNSEGFIKKQIDRARKDEQVKGIVVRVDSPGGTVTASHYLYHHLRKLKKEREIPLVVSMGGIAASGGYYISMAVGDEEDAIYAEPATWTGSIGVIIPHYDLSDLLAKWDVKDDSITSGPLKQMGSSTRKLSEEQRAEERAVLQALVDESFNDFKDVVRYGRPLLADDEETLTKATTGQIFTAKQAHAMGLVDQLGFIEDAVKRVRELADLDEEETKVVEYSRQTSLFGLLSGAQAQAQAQPFDLSVLLDMTAPRAWYLCSWMPSVVATN